MTDKEIKVGVLAPLSGYAAFLGEVEVDAVKAFLFDANAKGGAKGKQYRVVVADTRFEPATEAVGARRLVEQEKVFALFTTFSDTIGPYVASKGIPNFAFGIVPPAFSSKYPTIYPVGLDTVDSITTMAYTLTQVLKKPIKSVAIAYGTQNIAWGQWADYAKKAWEQFGVQVKSMDRFNVSDGDCTQLVLKIQNLNVDFWQVGNSLGWPLCGQAMHRQGYRPPQGFGGPYTDDINWGNQMGPGYDGVFAMTNGVSLQPDRKGTPWPYDPSGVAPAVDHYMDSMKKYSPKSGTLTDMEGIWPQSFWAQAKALHEAVLRQTDAITWEGVNKWLQAQKNWSSGIVSPGSFAPNCKTNGVQTYIYSYKWNAQANSVEETDWKPYGGVVKVPTEVKNKVMPGGGDCYLTAYADAKL
ncbi:MAG: ABC transporter substrate-binding protein [Actinomycetota bacterium]